MAEIVTLPVDELPDLAVTRKAAEWEQTFKQPAPVLSSLAGRHWENQATLENVANETAHAERALKQRAMVDQTAQNYLFKAQELPMKMEKHELEMKKGIMTLQHEQQLHPLKLQTEEARTARLLSQDREAVKKARLNENLAIQASMDNEAFMDNMAASNAKPGTQEFVDELVRNRERFPGSRVVYNDLFKAHAGSDDDPEEVFKTRKAALAAAGANTTVATKLPGGVTITDRPVADHKVLIPRLTRLESMRQRETDPEKKAYFEEAILETKAQLSGTGSQPPAAPTTAAAPVSESPDSFKAAFAAAQPGTTLTFRGKTYRKP